jgi:hypothetical protein
MIFSMAAKTPAGNVSRRRSQVRKVIQVRSARAAQQAKTVKSVRRAIQARKVPAADRAFKVLQVRKAQSVIRGQPAK